MIFNRSPVLYYRTIVIARLDRAISFFLLLILSNNILAAVTCFDSTEECVEGKDEVRYIENVPVNPGCWKKRVIHECRAEATNDCQQLRTQGCSQVGAKCKSKIGESCVVQEATYQCPQQKCETIKTPCMKNIFCLDGTCAPTSATKNHNFDQAAAYLAAVAEAAQEVAKQNKENPVIFAGRAMECSRNVASGITKNCCGISPSGFLEGKILKCDDEEKELAKRKEQGTAIYIGEYCHTKTPKPLEICTSHHEVYCVFDNKIARIIQHDGRRGQLGIGFGHAGKDTKLDCRGITPEELASMDFKKMDFSALYSDIKNNLKIPNMAKMKPTGSKLPTNLQDLQTSGLIKQIDRGSDVNLIAAERIKDFYGERTKK